MKKENYSQHKIKAIISGGGTGGHIFPAIAIANELKDRFPESEILFVGAKDKMEMEKVPEAGYPIEGLWISGLQRKLTLKNLMFPFKVISSLWRSHGIIKKFKPDIAIGVGGFASGPLLRVATRKGVPSLIQEQNSYPGITNKLLAASVDRICVAYENMDRFFPKEKIVLTGNPIRKNVIELEGKRDKGIEFFGLSKNKTTLLVVGGSLGALAVNKGISANLELFIAKGIQLIWQTGKYYHSQALKDVREKGDDTIKVVEFIKEMDMAYAAADIIISRAGAIAISEICAVKKPAVFVPLPTAAEDHQTKNAMALVQSNAAILVRNEETIEKLGKEIIALKNDLRQQQILSENLGKFAITNAAERIVNEVISLTTKN
jgi:UDP-N-acetylglucosamine--N-acetylmuramyl-(pentapeptide) pyrophosphoryl-undecaprenol N-acetylglucosamine transferase